MASVGFGSSVAAVAPASSAGRTSGRALRRTRLAVPAATRGTPAPAKKEKSFLEFIVSSIVKDEQEFIETNPLLNGPAEASSKASGTTSGKKAGGTTFGKKAGGTTSAGKKPAADSDGGGGGFKLGGLFAKKG